MNSILTPPSPPHQLQNPRLSPPSPMPDESFNNKSLSKKRKADDEDEDVDQPVAFLPHAHGHSDRARTGVKRSRTVAANRSLPLPRLLETLDAEALRAILQNLCSHNTSLTMEIERNAPRPSVSSALDVLKRYERTMLEAVPFGGTQGTDYAFYRIRSHLMQLLDALADFVPHFLPSDGAILVSQSLAFLDGATQIIHDLPSWQSAQNNIHKQEAYEEICKAWVHVVLEAGKKAGGMHLRREGWDVKLRHHDVLSGGLLQSAIQALDQVIGWMEADLNSEYSQRSNDVMSVRQQLLSGTYGSGISARVSPW